MSASLVVGCGVCCSVCLCFRLSASLYVCLSVCLYVCFLTRYRVLPEQLVGFGLFPSGRVRTEIHRELSSPSVLDVGVEVDIDADADADATDVDGVWTLSSIFVLVCLYHRALVFLNVDFVYCCILSCLVSVDVFAQDCDAGRARLPQGSQEHRGLHRLPRPGCYRGRCRPQGVKTCGGVVRRWDSLPRSALSDVGALVLVETRVLKSRLVLMSYCWNVPQVRQRRDAETTLWSGPFYAAFIGYSKFLAFFRWCAYNFFFFFCGFK